MWLMASSGESQNTYVFCKVLYNPRTVAAAAAATNNKLYVRRAFTILLMLRRLYLFILFYTLIQVYSDEFIGFPASFVFYVFFYLKTISDGYGFATKIFKLKYS